MGRVLIIEDEIDQAELYRMALEGAGHEVVGLLPYFEEPALRKSKAPDLVILDERLGGRSGSALIPDIRKSFPAARILILTADPDVAESALKIGADDGRMKPLPMAQLVGRVTEMIGSSRS
jgi:two-component system nitrogen regulation response regulator GlnG